MAKQYGGERATYDNGPIIGKVVFPCPKFPRRTYCPAYGGACVRYADGEGTTHCAAAPPGRQPWPGWAAWQCGARKFWAGENDRVARFRASRNSPPYCRFRTTKKARLRASPSLKGTGRICFPPFHYFLARPQSLARAWAPQAARGARGRAGAGHKVRPGGPTNWPAWRASAAALRGGGANGQRARPLPLWR